MESLFKKFIFTGVGLLSLTKDKIEKIVDELVSEEKISTKEGKKIVNDFLESAEGKKEEIEKQIKVIVEKVSNKFDFAKQDEIEELQKRIEKLEAKIAKKKKK